MLIVALFSWWYTTAWKNLGHRIEGRVDMMLDFFSVKTLLKTLFDPFRQISAGATGGSVDDKMKAFADRSFSRVFGAVVRTLFILLGVVCSAIILVIGGIQMAVWPLIPALPILSVIAYAVGLKI